MTTEVKDVVARILGGIGSTFDDELTLSGDEARSVVSLLESLSSQVTEAQNLAERMKLEAQCHAGEARAANSTIYEIYQVLSGGKGEPGNWHGAQPARDYVAAAESRATAAEGRVALLEEALATVVELLDSSIATHRFNAQHMIAEDTLVDAWGMLNMAREQFDTDANQLVTIREAARARLAKGGQ